MRNLSTSARGADVLFLQRMLNKRGAKPQLAEDEIFGPRTQHAVTAFQNTNRIGPPHGVADRRLWARFGAIVEYEHRVQLFGQPTNMTCWSAAATMITGNIVSIGPGSAKTGGSGGLQPDLENIETFLGGLNWKLLNNMSAPPTSHFVAGLSRGPLWIAFEGGTFKHAVVASAIWSDSADDRTVMRIHDPWPPGAGTIYGSTYVGRRMQVKSVSPPRAAMVQYVASAR